MGISVKKSVSDITSIYTQTGQMWADKFSSLLQTRAKAERCLEKLDLMHWFTEKRAEHADTLFIHLPVSTQLGSEETFLFLSQDAAKPQRVCVCGSLVPFLVIACLQYADMHQPYRWTNVPHVRMHAATHPNVVPPRPTAFSTKNKKNRQVENQ